MGKLNEAAARVDSAWCKGNFRKEEQSRAEGDSYCALGAIAAALLPQNTLLSIDGEMFGDRDKMLVYDKLSADYQTFWTKFFRTPEEDRSDEDSKILSHLDNEMVELVDTFGDTGEFLENREEIKVLAEVIKDNYPDRVAHLVEQDKNKNNTWSHRPGTYVWNFNDHDDTTREDVVAMMQKADQLLEDRALEEETRVDELIAEVDELINV